MITEPDEPAQPGDSVRRIIATITGASILGLRRVNMARTQLIERSPTAGHLVDDAIVVALSGVGPSSKLTAEACRTAASLSPEPLAEAWRVAGDTAATVGRVVHLTGLDQPAPTRSPRPKPAPTESAKSPTKSANTPTKSANTPTKSAKSPTKSAKSPTKSRETQPGS